MRNRSGCRTLNHEFAALHHPNHRVEDFPVRECDDLIDETLGEDRDFRRHEFSYLGVDDFGSRDQQQYVEAASRQRTSPAPGMRSAPWDVCFNARASRSHQKPAISPPG